MTKENEGLDFEKAKDLTVGEAVRKEAELKAGVTNEDGILDKYIKQHPDEVASKKFETKDSSLEELDTTKLDDFIKQQRKEIQDKIEDDSTMDDIPVVAAVEEEPVYTIPTATAAANQLSEEPTLESDSSEASTSFYKRKTPILLGLLILLLAIFGGAYYLNHSKQSSLKSSPSKTSTTSSQTSTTTSSDEKEAKKANQSFEDMYKAFFTDDKMVKLKNSEFDKLAELGKRLESLKDTKYYTSAKEKYDYLKGQIEGIQAINAKFDKPVVVDGHLDDSAKLKTNANFDDLSTKTLNTGNATLDVLLQAAIKKGRDEISSVKSKTTTSTDQSEKVENKTEAQSNATTPSAPQQSTQTEQANTQTQTTPVSPATSYGITNYNPAILERNMSRVPYNNSAIADSSNSAWQFNPGVLEKIIATAQARGNISGNNFILERVNIINGNGYYNMFKPDGTYLFSINDKTGYFVGNKPGNADALDY